MILLPKIAYPLCALTMMSVLRPAEALTGSSDFYSDSANLQPIEFTRKVNQKLTNLHRQRRDTGGGPPKTKTYNVNVGESGKYLTLHRTRFDKATGHTHAFIHWAGQGSKVIFILTLKKDTSWRTKTENVRESFLYRSADYGEHWEPVNSKTSTGFPDEAKLKKYAPSGLSKGFTIFIDDQDAGLGEYTHHDGEKTPAKGRIVITQDKGHSYSTHPLPFKMDDFKYHPVEASWVLAYDAGRKGAGSLWVSLNKGEHWNLLTNSTLMHVTEKRWFWGVQNFDDPRVVHFEYRSMEIMPPSKYYAFSCDITHCLNSMESDVNKHNLGLGPIAKDSLTVEQSYIFAEKQVSNSFFSPKLLYTSYNRTAFSKAYFTSNEKFTRYHVVSAKSDYIVLGVLDSDKKKSNFYVSNKMGNVFWLTLPSVRSNRESSRRSYMRSNKDPFKVDCVTMSSLVGVVICNQWNDTRISYNAGSTWQKINVPGQVTFQNNTKANSVVNAEKSLHFHLTLKHSARGYYMPKFYSLSDGDYGHAYAHARWDNWPEKPSDDDKLMGAYMTRDGGVTWKQILEGRHVFTASDFGRQVLARRSIKFDEATELDYSMDYGETFTNITYTNKPIQVDGILTEPGSHTPYFTIFGHPKKSIGEGENQSKNDAWHIITVDSTKIFEKDCTVDNYENWTFKVPKENAEKEEDLKAVSTSLGMVRQIKRIKEGKANDCKNVDTILTHKEAQSSLPQPCTANDYTCGYMYTLEDEFCNFNKEHWKIMQDHHDLTWFDTDTLRWPMKVPGDNCTTDLPWYKEEDFFKKNIEHLTQSATGYGRGWKISVKDVSKDTMPMTSCEIVKSKTDAPVGATVRVKVGGQFTKQKDTHFSWTHERFVTTKEHVDGKFIHHKNTTKVGDHEWDIRCNHIGTNIVTVNMTGKNGETLYTGTIRFTCWNTIKEEDVLVSCTPRSKAHTGDSKDDVFCRALVTEVGTSEDDKEIMKERTDIDYRWSTSQLETDVPRTGVSGSGAGRLIAFQDFKTADLEAHVLLSVSNRVCKIKKNIPVAIVDADDTNMSLIGMELTNLTVDVNNADSIARVYQIGSSIKDEHLSSLKYKENEKDVELWSQVFIPELVLTEKSATSRALVYLTQKNSDNTVSKRMYENVLQHLKTEFQETNYAVEWESSDGDTTVLYAVSDLELKEQSTIDSVADQIKQTPGGNLKLGDIQNSAEPTSTGGFPTWLLYVCGFVGITLLALGVLFGVRRYRNARHKYRNPEQEFDDFGCGYGRDTTNIGVSDTVGIIDHDELNDTTRSPSRVTN